MSRAKKTKKRLGQIARGAIMAPSLPAAMGVLKLNQKLTKPYQKVVKASKPAQKAVKTLIPTKVDDAVIDTLVSVQEKSLPKTGKVSGKIANAYGRWVKTGSFKKKAKKEVDTMSNEKNISKENDQTWYNEFPELVNLIGTPNFTVSKDVQKLFNTAFQRVVNTTHSIDTRKAYSTSIASIFVADVKMMCGKGEHSAEYINSMNRLMTGLRNALKSNLIYDAADLHRYTWNVREIVAIYSHLRRIYLLSLNYSAEDTHLPESVIRLLGADPDEIRKNRADLRDFLINVKAMMSIYAALDTHILRRTEWLFSNIFQDDKSKNPQYYIFRPRTFYTISNDTENVNIFSASVDIDYNANFEDFDPSTSTYSSLTLQGWMDLLMQSVLTFTRNKLTGVISADLVNAFSSAQKLYHLPDVPENGNLQPVYSEEVLNQIQNMSVTVLVNDNEGLDYKINANNELYYYEHQVQPYEVDEKAAVDLDTDVFNKTPLLFYKNEVTKLDAVTATRLRVFYQNETDEECTLQSYGTEIVVKAGIYSFGFWEPSQSQVDYEMPSIEHYSVAHYLPFGQVVSLGGTMNIFGSATVTNRAQNIMFAEYLLSSFRYLPPYRTTIAIPYRRAANDYDDVRTVSAIIVDYNNLAIASLDDLEALHKVANMSLHYYPITFKETKSIKVLKTF